MDTKYVIFFLIFLIGVPVGALACMAVPALSRWVMVALIWSTCEPNMLGINFVSREFYRANTRGFEVLATDLFALVLILFMLLKRKEYPLRLCPPLTIPTLLYLLVGFISWTQIGPSLPVPDEATVVPYAMFEIKLYPLFELSKILRGFIMYLVIVNYVRDEKSARTVMLGIVVTALYMSWSAISSRYLYGVNRVRATLGHPNSLATYMAMLGIFTYALLLQSRKYLASIFYGAVTLLCGVSVILTISRGGLMAFALGVWVNTLAFFPRHLNAKNILLLAVGALLAMSVLFVAMDTLMTRFFSQQNASEDIAFRGRYNSEAKLMAREHTWGVGLGNFSAWSWVKYAKDVDPDMPPGTPAHNNWYLTLGEVGVPGVLALALLWLRYFGLAIPMYFRGRQDLLHTLAVASCTAVMADQLQSCLQLGYRQTPMYFMMMIFVGLTVAGWYARREAQPPAAGAGGTAPTVPKPSTTGPTHTAEWTT